jgi:hypothetical protein
MHGLGQNISQLSISEYSTFLRVSTDHIQFLFMLSIRNTGEVSHQPQNSFHVPAIMNSAS